MRCGYICGGSRELFHQPGKKSIEEKSMNQNDCIIRLERKEEHREVENLAREAFWNVYRRGAWSIMY
jgi:hypothetical protein